LLHLYGFITHSKRPVSLPIVILESVKLVIYIGGSKFFSNC